MRFLLSLLVGSLSPIVCLALLAVWITYSTFMSGFGAEGLSPAEREAVWASGYRIQWFVILILPPLIGAIGSYAQRRIAPQSRRLWALFVVTPATFVVLLANLLVLYAWSAVLLVVYAFAGALLGIVLAEGSRGLTSTGR